MYAVSPLPTDDAVALFVARARAAGAGLEATAAEMKLAEEICERLDGLPLAVELAAARARALTLPRLLERLEQRLPLLIGGPRDLPARQQTLRSTLEWSSDLLDDDARQLFARLAVFPGSFSLDAAEAVCDASLEGLETLIDFSLLGSTGERFAMLATVRRARRRAPRSIPPRSDIRALHARYFAVLAAGMDFKGAGTGSVAGRGRRRLAQLPCRPRLVS